MSCAQKYLSQLLSQRMESIGVARLKTLSNSRDAIMFFPSFPMRLTASPHGSPSESSWVQLDRVTTESDPGHPIAKNLIHRGFAASRPNEKWVTDITYSWTAEGSLYLAIVMDLYSHRIVGWPTANHMKTEPPGVAPENPPRARHYRSGAPCAWPGWSGSGTRARRCGDR